MTTIHLADTGVTMALVASLKASLPDFGCIVDLFGHPAPALRKLGLVHWERGRFDTATRTFEPVLSLAPDDPDLWRDLASVYSASGHLKAAATDFVILETVESSIRLEASRPVPGLYVVMKRR